MLFSNLYPFIFYPTFAFLITLSELNVYMIREWLCFATDIRVLLVKILKIFIYFYFVKHIK